MSKIKEKQANSLFGKYYATNSIVLFATILLMGILILVFSAKYLSSVNQKQLKKNADQAVEVALSSMEEYRYQMISSSIIGVGFNVISTVSDTMVFLSDVSGNIVVCSNGEENGLIMSSVVPKEIMDTAMKGEFKETGNFSGLYSKTHYTVGVPVEKDDTILAVVFVSSEATDFWYYVYDLIDIIIICALIATIVSSVVVYFVSNRMTKPLRQMAAATKSFSEGDFTARVPVDGKDEIAQLAGSFNHMADALADMESVRRNFIANVSHELKTPMMTIGGFVDGILDGTVPKEKERHYLETVSEEVKRLSRMVKSMLTISRIEAGDTQLNCTVFDINDLICRTVFTFEQKIEAKKLDVVGLESDGTYVKADNDLIHQVVFNLIDNAVKFANEGGCLSFLYKTEGDRVYISIRNTGEGVSQEELPRLFDRFYKTDKSRSLDKTGFGLGLYIVQTIINQHKGDLVVKSVEGEYTEFTFSVETADSKDIPDRRTWNNDNSSIAST